MSGRRDGQYAEGGRGRSTRGDRGRRYGYSNRGRTRVAIGINDGYGDGYYGYRSGRRGYRDGYRGYYGYRGEGRGHHASFGYRSEGRDGDHGHDWCNWW